MKIYQKCQQFGRITLLFLLYLPPNDLRFIQELEKHQESYAESGAKYKRQASTTSYFSPLKLGFFWIFGIYL